MISTTISTLPTPPSRNDPGTFSDRADALIGALPTLVTQLNSFISEINQTSFKNACKVATTVNISRNGTSATIDGQSIQVGDRVLVKNQDSLSQNGVYVVSAGDWVRAVDMDTTEKIVGSFVPVTFGTQNGGKIFYTTFVAGSTLNFTSMSWSVTRV